MTTPDTPPNATTAPAAAGSAPPARPATTRRVVAIALGLGAVLAGGLAAAVVPRRAQQRTLAAGAAAASDSTPTVSVAAAVRAPAATSLTLPGTVQGMHESAVYARAGGYVRRAYADIGSAVRAGQLLAVLDAPELQQDVAQGRAQLDQSTAALVLARNNLARWRVLAADGAATPQELDQYASAFHAAVSAEAAARANVRRLADLQRYTRVTAPFAGVVTARSVDEGALVSTAGSTSAGLAAGGALTAAQAGAAASLFRVAQADTVRVYISVPQNYAGSVRPGLAAELLAQNVPGHPFVGRVVRTARAVDPASRTLLTEVDVPNPTLELLPGMFAEVLLRFERKTPPLTVPATALVVRTAGPQVVVADSVRAGAKDTTGVLRYVSVQVGRDYGATVEVARGLADGARVVVNPADGLRTGQRARVVSEPAAPDSASGTGASATNASGTGSSAGPQANRPPAAGRAGAQP